jgi:hypothetical protein
MKAEKLNLTTWSRTGLERRSSACVFPSWTLILATWAALAKLLHPAPKRACCSTSTSTNRATSCFARCASSASKASYRSPGSTYRL